MNEAKFTPGPWKVERINSSFSSTITDNLAQEEWPFIIVMPAPPFALGKTGAAIAADPLRGLKESWANARLIAAAPELYTALKKIIDLGNHGYHSKIVGYDEYGWPLDQMGMARKQAEAALAKVEEG